MLGRHRRRRTLAVLLAIPLLALACGAEDTPDDAPAPTPETDPTPEAEPSPEAAITPMPSPTGPTEQAAEDARILGFTAPTVDGGEFDASVLAGRQLAIWFWAPW